MKDGIEPELCAVQCTSVYEASRRVRTLGRDTVLSKFDVCNRGLPHGPGASRR